MNREISPTESLASTVYILDDFNVGDKIAIKADASKTRVIGWQTGIIVLKTEDHYKVKFVKGVDVEYDKNKVEILRTVLQSEQWVVQDDINTIDTFKRRFEEIGNIMHQKQIFHRIYHID